MVTLDGDTPFNALDYIALVLVLFGLYWEIVGDYQLSRFKANPANKKCSSQHRIVALRPVTPTTLVNAVFGGDFSCLR